MAYTEVPRGVDSEPTPFDIRAKCEGDCAQNRKTRNNDFRTRGGGYLTLAPPFGKNFGSDVRSVTVVVERTCRRVLAPKIFEIVFGRDGKVDRRRSDLNGNGIADGKEKRR